MAKGWPNQDLVWLRSALSGARSFSLQGSRRRSLYDWTCPANRPVGCAFWVPWSELADSIWCSSLQRLCRVALGHVHSVSGRLLADQEGYIYPNLPCRRLRTDRLRACTACFIPSMGHVIRLLIARFGLVSTWIGAATAHETHGWRTVLLPVIAYLILVIVGFVIASLLLTGLGSRGRCVLTSLGIQTP